MRDTAASCSPELQEAYAGVVKEAEGLTEDLCQLMDALHHQNGAGVPQGWPGWFSCWAAQLWSGFCMSGSSVVCMVHMCFRDPIHAA